MKKLLAVVMMALAMLALAACGGGNSTQTPGQAAGALTQTAEQQELSALLDSLQEVINISPELRAYIEAMDPSDVTPELIGQMAAQEMIDSARQATDISRPERNEADTAQDETPPADVASGHARAIPASYHTVGEVVDLWGNWEIVIHEGARVVAPLFDGASRILDRDGVPERIQEIEEAGILLIPATVTRTNAPDQAGRRDGVAWLYQLFSVYGPNGQVMDGHRIPSIDEAIVWGMLFNPDTEELEYPPIGDELLPGESEHAYIWAIYDGDGDYLIRMRTRNAIYFLVPVNISN